jgi:endonuclease/exonuclease/phosphatase family metal-dependent hydrolase
MRGSWSALAIIFIGIILLLILLMGRVMRPRSVKNYTEPSGPYYEGYYASGRSDYNGFLKVVTWNINFAERIEQAVQTLTGVEALQDADILLLQEMDAEGVEVIAQALHYDYVYYPASVHIHHEKDFGNAILSKWPIIHSSKIILPNTFPSINQTRIVVKADMLIDGEELNVYNTHLETVWMVQRNGHTQVDFLAEQIDREGGFTILGGDFNSWSNESIAYLEERLAQAGLQRLSAGTGPTFEYKNMKLTLDHILTSDVLGYQAGVWRQTEASDHFPVWALLKLEEID